MSEPLVALKGVSAGYGHDVVVRDVTFAIHPGDLCGVVGPSGAGKTTVLRLLLGTLAPVAGRVVRRRDLRVGYVPQVETVDWSFPVTVAEVVLMARRRRLPWSSGEERREAAVLLARLGIDDLADRHIRDLSGGQQQRVFVARALLGRPELLLLDEPTSGVDVRSRHELLHVLDELNADGLAVCLTTHDLNGVAAHLPRIICLNRTVIAEGAPSAVLTPSVLERTYGAAMDVLEHAGMPVVVDRPRRSAPVGRRAVG